MSVEANHWRVDKLTPEEDAARLEKIRRKTEQARIDPDDLRIDYSSEEFRSVAPAGWTRRKG